MGSTENQTPEYKKHAVEIYLEQIKVLTALSSALFISPSIVFALMNLATESINTNKMVPLAVTSSVLFLLAIILTYFIYSSLVGRINVGEYNIERHLTMNLSRLQFVFVLLGCIFYVMFIVSLINGLRGHS